MKKFATAAILTVTLFIALLTGKTQVKADALTFDRAYQDYQYNLTVYNQAFSDFQDARDAYKANQTLALKETARQKLLAMLVDRDQLMVVYLTALRTKISELDGLSPDDKNSIFGKIDSEVNFYTNHKGQYHTQDPPDQLFATSSQSENQYKDSTSLVVQESLFDISLGQVSGLRQEHEKVFSTLKTLIDQGVKAGTLTRDPFNQWLGDIDQTENTLKQNEETSRTQIAEIYTQNYSFGGGYKTAIGTLSDSVKPLSQLNEYLTEVLNYIETHQ